LAHRLAWLVYYGVWPAEQLDHVNGDKLDNRIANLREVSNQTNNQNHRKAKKNSKTGFLGVVHEKRGDGYVAYLRVAGRTKNLGTYRTPEEAHSVYLREKRRLHEGCTI
jgi:HNH endonuclease